MKNELNVSIGYSDHTENIEALYLATVYGADVLEFHFTNTKEGQTFRDHKVSLTKDDIDLLVNKIKRADSIFGSNIKAPTTSELENNHLITFRRAIYPNRDIQMGEKISHNDLIALRPNNGIDARDGEKIIGKNAKKNIKMLSLLNFDMFE